MSSPVAFITGGCSGIGLALSRHLLGKGWHVAMIDLQPPPGQFHQHGDSTLFLKADVSSWEQQVDAFAQAFEWKGRLDMAALNAGIDDRDDIFNSVDPATPPRKPNMSPFDIDLLGVYYGIKLFAHYASRNPNPGGKIIMTSSAAGLYGSAGMPQYAAAKAGVISLARSLARPAARHNITINAICPMMVNTSLPPRAFLEAFPKEHITPMEIVIQAFDEYMDSNRGFNGQVCETTPKGVVYRDPIKPLGDLSELDDLAQEKFVEVFRDRNVRYARGE